MASRAETHYSQTKALRIEVEMVGPIFPSSLQPARLIPITGIKGALDQERRATSALLAVFKIVPELAYAVLAEAKAPKGKIETFIEPEFKINGKKIRPDGLIEVHRGKQTWRALVEVKTGKNLLELEQINNYLDICRDYNVDALITVSNQLLNASGLHPTEGIDARKLRSTKLMHLSWVKIITESLVLSEHTGVEDSERDLVLRELIRFLQSDASGASEFSDMGADWVRVREDIRSGTLRKADDSVLETVKNFEALVRFAALRLSAKLGVRVSEVVDRGAAADYRKHLLASAQNLLASRELRGALLIPGAASRIQLRADLGSGLLHCAAQLDAPHDGRNRSRLNWLLRQLKKNPEGVLVAWAYRRSRSLSLSHRVQDLLRPDYEFELDNGRELVQFEVSVIRPMGSKRMAGSGSFIDSVVTLFEDFYKQVLEGFKPWQVPAPKLSESVRDLIPDQPGDRGLAEVADEKGREIRG